MTIFSEILEKARSNRFSVQGIPYVYSNKLTNLLGGIKKRKVYSICGRDTSGKRSFVDFHFVIGVYIWWLNLPEGSRPPIKILYFNMDKSPEVKFTKWVCLYMWLFYSKLIDLETINGGYGKLFDVDAETDVQIQQGYAFFEGMLESGFLNIYNGPTNPTGIRNQVRAFMQTVGGDLKESYNKVWLYDEKFAALQTIIIIDNVSMLKSESRKELHMDSKDLHCKLAEYIQEFKDYYGATVVPIIPSFPVPGIYKLSQMTPDYREFLYYYDVSDMALNLFNPFKYGITDHMQYTLRFFTSAFDGVHRLRFCNIIKNTDGRNSATIPYVFFPENGFLSEASLPTEIENYQKTIDFISSFKLNQINDANSRITQFGVTRYDPNYTFSNNDSSGDGYRTDYGEDNGGLSTGDAESTSDTHGGSWPTGESFSNSGSESDDAEQYALQYSDIEHGSDEE